MSRIADETMSREEPVSEAFVALADTLVDDYDIIELLYRLVGYSVRLLAADAAGLMLGDNSQQLRVVAASSEDAELMELLQLQADRGTMPDCYRTATPVAVPDLATAGRWPAFVAAVAERGAFASVHALPMRLRGQAIGAMKPVPPRTPAATARGPRPGPGAGRRGHHRHPA